MNNKLLELEDKLINELNNLPSREILKEIENKMSLFAKKIDIPSIPGFYAN